MAGHISISEDVGISLGTPAFYDIVELIRLEALEGDDALVAKIYDGADLMQSISVQGINNDEFNKFAGMVLRAYEKCKDQPEHARDMALWRELTRKVKSDPRYRSWVSNS